MKTSIEEVHCNIYKKCNSLEGETYKIGSQIDFE